MLVACVSMRFLLVRLVLLVVTFWSVTSYESFQSKLPNGNIIPFPCKPGQIWDGVGHILYQGTGNRNPFGLDFAAAGNTWTSDLCPKDSDGDGMTNGQEMGDPDCTWTENDIPKTSIGLSHPGICDPWNSDSCMRKPLTQTEYATQSDWLSNMCKTGGFVCPAINETDIRKMELRLADDSRVPPKETTYQCQLFDLNALGLPRNQDFHMVAVTPIIDNRKVLHHMALFGCTSQTAPTPGPFECGMIPSETCTEFLHVWAVGSHGECYHPHSGIRIGEGGYKIFGLQLHRTNPDERDDFTDSSGLLLYYTPTLRSYDAGILVIGSTYFYLPPKKQQLTVQSTCSSACTRRFMEGIVNVTSAVNHMHYAGNKMNIKVQRNNAHVTYLTNDVIYSYDSPQMHLYPEPFQLFPCESISSTCGYTTLNRNKTTFWGEATQDEELIRRPQTCDKDWILECKNDCSTNTNFSGHRRNGELPARRTGHQ